jgi:hypothetical protein
MSSRMMSGSLSFSLSLAICKASSPSAAVVTSKPALDKARSLASRRNLLSSTSSTLDFTTAFAGTGNPRMFIGQVAGNLE